ADAGRVRGLIVDFHEWANWSPWEDLDPEMERVYSGAPSGVGARYAWKGNRKVGRGDMEITSVSDDAVGVRITFGFPMRSTNQVRFGVEPQGEGTLVTWQMSGQHTGVMALLGRVMPMDRVVGRDFEKGLARLKVAAES
ncbi:SRPBCC family protein, partial [Nocardia alni]|uniref:SRPBCC family protein n=1 Tax=Nocardia alni TaxID=2815723 RepID=UPI001C241F63